MSFKNTLQKVWYFIWEDDSIWSWLVNVLLAIVLIKFIVYPGLGFLLGTTHPIVAVVSGSMEHDGSFNDWWASQQEWYFDKAITKERFQTFPFTNGFNKGDIMILYRPTYLKLGDVIVFRTSRPEPIIHRIVSITNNHFQTKGDHNADSTREEQAISQEAVIGKAIFKIPYLGYIKIWAVEMLCVFHGENSICTI